MEENTFFRKLTITDAESLNNLARKTHLETFEQMNPPGLSLEYLNENITTQILENELIDQGSEYYFLEKNNLPIGYLKVRFDNFAENKLAGEHSAELQRIYVLTCEKGKGYGKKMLNFAEEIARKNGFKLLWLGVWEKNEAAIGFYKKCGYEKFAAHDFWYGTDLQNDFMLRKVIG